MRYLFVYFASRAGVTSRKCDGRLTEGGEFHFEASS